MKPFNIDPLEAAVFACGFLVAIMLVRALKARQATRSMPAKGAFKAWAPAATALILLLALWLYLK